MEFQGHYNEVPLAVDFNTLEQDYYLFKAIYDPQEGVWEDI
jgi:hypothetical protein